ncbi:uncharacterized protein LOC106159076 isoform X1 [Lingula anatina]|uniref:Uncharacterized protein LOC106159076 isoform X1 n=1 Tax=Lingula anatina TaxID=7574 RepID=A0A1S3HYR3_LINAN|nr:uncharacterized protein LOC106159076 isoform X1 [Lingula anatina]|eukprot:XP_013390711.1 uncharacterized protein LOC106159076 isoform X1 [Lingula anatina]
MIVSMVMLPLVFVVFGLQGVVGQGFTYFGPKSTGADDAASIVACPPGFVGTDCACSNDADRCDGAYFNSDGVCTARNTYRKSGIRARVTCQPLESLLHMTSVGSPGYVPNPVVSCPDGSHLLHCGLSHPWMQDESDPQFNVVTDVEKKQCRLEGKQCVKCRLYAYCIAVGA